MKRPISLILLASFLSGCREKDTLFISLDVNKDRRLSLSELENGVADGFFKTYDANQDGMVSTAEWRKLDPAGDPVFMKQRDPNRDGKITRKEALAAIHRRGFCREVLQDADRNNNGFVDPPEARLWASDHPEIIERLKIGD